MEKILKALTDAGVIDKIITGGVTVNLYYANKIDADGCNVHSVSAFDLTKRLILQAYEVIKHGGEGLYINRPDIRKNL